MHELDRDVEKGFQSVCLQKLIGTNTDTQFVPELLSTCLSNISYLCNRQALTLLSLQQRLCNKLKSIFLNLSTSHVFHPVGNVVLLSSRHVCVCLTDGEYD